MPSSPCHKKRHVTIISTSSTPRLHATHQHHAINASSFSRLRCGRISEPGPRRLLRVCQERGVGHRDRR
jgi:hypothetical protein